MAARNVSRRCTPPPTINSSSTSVNTRCRRSPWGITDVCVTHAYMHPLRWRPDHCPTQSMGYDVPGGKLNRGLSGVYLVANLKDCEHRNPEYFSRRPSSAGPSNGAVSSFPFHHHCTSLTCISLTTKVPSIFPRFRQHNGFGHYPSWPAPAGTAWTASI